MKKTIKIIVMVIVALAIVCIGEQIMMHIFMSNIPYDQTASMTREAHDVYMYNWWMRNYAFMDIWHGLCGLGTMAAIAIEILGLHGNKTEEEA